MKTDFSKIIYDNYFNRSNRLIEVTLKNNRKIHGIFISFVRGDFDCNEPYIIKWLIVEEKYKMTLGIDAFGFGIGEIINHNEITCIKFLDDNTQMNLE